MYTGLVINDVATGVGYTDWVFQNDDYLILRAFFLSWLIPMAFLLDSHVVIGPGLAFYARSEPPSIFLEGGVGLSSNQSVADERFTMGAAVFGGAGVDVTKHLGFVLRVLWAPSGLNSRWTPEGEALSLLAMLRFH